jgi:hypothetical protein
MSPGLRVLSFCSLLGLLFSGGCSSKISTADPGPPPPHGGTIVFFPDRSGVVEVVKKDGKEPMISEVSFYFFADAWTPYEPAPESGVLVLSDERTISLKADGDALVTPPGPPLFADGDVDGVLRVTIDGETRQIPLGVR